MPNALCMLKCLGPVSLSMGTSVLAKGYASVVATVIKTRLELPIAPDSSHSTKGLISAAR